MPALPLIRPLHAADVEIVAGLELFCNPMPWSVESLRAFAAENPPVGRLVRLGVVAAEGAIEKRVAGYLCVSLLEDEAEILVLGVHPDFRRRGLARALMGEMLADLARRGCRSVFLEVRTGNTAARALYRSLGFAETGVRKGYYADTGEDAFVLRRGMLNSPSMPKAILSTRHGDITIEFLPEVAPNHVQNFVDLAKQGFYDGTLFHRVIPGFMIQGGDPNSKQADKRLHGTGGSGKNVKAEFSKTPHARGTVSAARSSNPDSASSQFFIVVEGAPHLDGQYSAFGKVVSGMDVADKIVAEETDHRDNPANPVAITVKIVED